MQVLRKRRKEVWQSKVWKWAKDVAAEHAQWASPLRPGRQVESLPDLLSRPEWEGSVWSPGSLWDGDVEVPCTVVRHPSGAEARIRVKA